jgi:hypothetical protein
MVSGSFLVTLIALLVIFTTASHHHRDLPMQLFPAIVIVIMVSAAFNDHDYELFLFHHKSPSVPDCHQMLFTQ